MKSRPFNYKHLYYFWVASREGSLTKAAERLELSVQTISEQIGLLERDLGRALLAPQGRRLVPTEAGRVAAGFADQIFLLGEQLREAMSDSALDRVVRLSVGMTDALPKMFAYRLVQDALKRPGELRLTCMEGELDELLADLAMHKLDVVLSDRPVSGGSNLRVFNHVLGECAVGLFGMPELAAKYRPGFPQSLTGAPLLLPARTNALRGRLDYWFESRHLRPVVLAEFEDSAFLNTVGGSGHGLFPAPMALAADVSNQYGAEFIGELDGVKEQFFAISNERKIRHPGVEVILESSVGALFANAAGPA